MAKSRYPNETRNPACGRNFIACTRARECLAIQLEAVGLQFVNFEHSLSTWSVLRNFEMKDCWFTLPRPKIFRPRQLSKWNFGLCNQMSLPHRHPEELSKCTGVLDDPKEGHMPCRRSALSLISDEHEIRNFWDFTLQGEMLWKHYSWWMPVSIIRTGKSSVIDNSRNEIFEIRK